MSRRRSFSLVVLATVLAPCLARPAHAEDAAVSEDLTLRPLADAELEGAAAIAAIEHSRGDPAGLDVHLTPDAPPALRRRALVALGRIGDRPGVEARLRAAIERGGADLDVAVWAAGLSGAKGLVPAILPLLDHGTPTNRGWALYALGDAGEKRADGFVLPFLEGSDARETVPASYAVVALEAERALEALVALAVVAPPETRARAFADAWRLAGARKRARETKDAPWTGDVALARRIAPFAARDADPEVRAFAHRALAVLLPATRAPNPDDRGDPVAVALSGAADRDPRIVADVTARFLRRYAGPGASEALWTAGYDADALVRTTVAETLAASPSDGCKAVAADLLAHERDPRVRLALAVAIAVHGDLALATATIDATTDPVLATAAGVARAKALGAAAKTDAEARAALLALGRDVSAPILVREAVLEAVGALLDDAAVAAYGVERLVDPDPIVRAAAAGLVGAHGAASDLAALRTRYAGAAGPGERDFRQGLVEAIGALAKRHRASDGGPAAESALAAALDDPSPVVRAAAREAARDVPVLAERAATVDPTPNEWTSLPRPTGPLLGLDLSKGEGRLTELEILRLAEAIRTTGTRVRFETDAGTIDVALDTVWTPVHAVNLVLAAAAGVYDGTTWHRVVPGFVIQGGDPRGDGSGDAGHSIPDEIAPHASFQRGTLGMPKSTKDTGGCQLFLMHLSAPHLDQRYTAYGEAVSGIDVIDRIRVGDRILKATLVSRAAASDVAPK